MAKNKNEKAIRRYNILVLKRRGVTRDLPSGTESLQWVTNTATLIYGERDAVVVDTFATIDQNQRLVDWITKSGKNLTTIYITHAHGDHSFGIKILQRLELVQPIKLMKQFFCLSLLFHCV